MIGPSFKPHQCLLGSAAMLVHGDGTLDQCQTDTDPSGHLCILVDIHVRARTTSRTHNIRVKADPGADANLMPLHHFREIFPYLCDKNGKPKEGVLERQRAALNLTAVTMLQ